MSGVLCIIVLRSQGSDYSVMDRRKKFIFATKPKCFHLFCLYWCMYFFMQNSRSLKEVFDFSSISWSNVDLVKKIEKYLSYTLSIYNSLIHHSHKFPQLEPSIILFWFIDQYHIRTYLRFSESLRYKLIILKFIFSITGTLIWEKFFSSLRESHC